MDPQHRGIVQSLLFPTRPAPARRRLVAALSLLSAVLAGVVVQELAAQVPGPAAASEPIALVPPPDAPGIDGKAAAGVLAVHPRNRRYFTTGDPNKAIYFAGTHHRDNLQDVGISYPPPAFNFNAKYPPADVALANFIRGWHWEHSRWQRDNGINDWILPLPFARTGPGNANDGKLKFDLTRYDGGYVSRLQTRAAAADAKNMFLGIMLFQGFSVQSLDPGEYPYLNHPFRSSAQINNINGLNGDWTTAYPEGGELHTEISGKPTGVINAQDNYVRQMVSSLNGYKNILWEVSNESHKDSLGWQNHVAAVIRSREQTLTNRHLIWISHPQKLSNVALYASSADVVSPSVNELAVTANGGTVAGTRYQTDPPVTSGSKVVILDTDHLKGFCAWCDRTWPWKAFTRGYHLALLDDLDDIEGDTPDQKARRGEVRKGMQDTLDYSKRIRLVEMSPQGENQTTPASTRYCLYTSDDPDPVPYAPAVPNGNQYLVFKPSTTSTVTIYNLPIGNYGGEWFNVSTRAVSTLPQLVSTGVDRTFTSPWGTQPAVLKLTRAPGVCTPSTTTLCLQNNRFSVTMDYVDHHNNTSGQARKVDYSSDTGVFWFFNAANVEAVVKVLDGRSSNGYWWVFHGNLTDLAYTLRVRDETNVTTVTYQKAAGTLCGAGDTSALPGIAPSAAVALPDARGQALAFPASAVGGQKAACTPSANRLCLLANRFSVEATYLDGGVMKPANAVSYNGTTGFFWFFGASNLELPVKVLDARAVDGHFWVFFGSLTNVGFSVKVTDTTSGRTKSYPNGLPFCGKSDTTFFLGP